MMYLRDMQNLSDIGARLVSARAAAGLSQRALGERLGVRQQQIARWERTGYRTASLERVVAVAEALGVGMGAPYMGAELAAEDPARYGAVLEPEAAAALRRTGLPYPALAAFARSHGVERIELFGSVLTPGFGPQSDVDILVTYAADRRPGLLEAADHETELAAMMRRPVDLVSRHAVERGANPVRRDAILGGAKAVYVAR